MKKVAFIIPTILRDNLLIEVLQSLDDNWSDDWRVFVIDQNEPESKEPIKFQKNSSIDLCKVKVSYNTGISVCRNLGVYLAKQEGIPYCFIGADSLKFNSSIQNLNNIINTTDADKIGFEIENRIPWEGWIKLIPNSHFELTYIKKERDKFFYPCNICRNFFVAKTDSLFNVKWDESLLMAEHEDHCWRYYNQGYSTVWTNDISGEYIGEQSKKSGDYAELRKKNWNDSKSLLLKKYNLKKWIKYTNAP